MQDYRHLRFLIVDDFSDFRSSLKAMLRDLGAGEVDSAEHGEGAIALCRQKRYDVILQDYNLGSGKNGQQVLEELHAAGLISHQCVFIMVTAESSQAMVLSALEHEPDGYLTKPFNRASLVQRLDKLLQRKALLRPVLQALDRREPAQVLSACDRLSREDRRLLPLCQRYRAGALRELARHEELERLLRAVLADRAIPWAYQSLGKLLQTRGEYVQARQLYEQALQAFPLQPGLYDGLAAALAALGESGRAQQVLQDAVQLAPLAIRRQARLGGLALRNEDFAVAARAYRQAVQQGQHSRFHSPEYYLGLSQALLDGAGGEGLDKAAQAEINQTLSELEQQYPADPAVRVRAGLLQARSLQRCGEPERAAQVVAQALAGLQQLEEFFAADTALSLAGQLSQLGQIEAAEQLLQSCVAIHGDDPAVLQGAARLSRDPAILGRTREAVEFNRQGVRAYQLGRFNDALELFRRALALQPQNFSIALNTAQSLLRQRGEQASPELDAECRACLDVVRRMSPADPRYERYQQLCSKVFET